MAYINVVRDPQIEFTPIIHALRQPSENEMGKIPNNPTEVQQTKVFGLLCPIMAINDIAVDFQDIELFELDCTGTLPRIKFQFRDRGNMLNNFSNPGNDNEIRIEILPPHDNTYKKINLTFISTDISINDGTCAGTAEYRLTDFTKAQFKALGLITTYDLFDKISTETGLGFATNVEATEDSRYMQCQFESYKDIVDREMQKSGSSETSVYDWWVDPWNNIILCDIYDRINSEDPEEDLQIWVAANNENASFDDDPELLKMTALFSNHPACEHTDLHVLDYYVHNEPASQSRGNMIALSVYEENKKEYIDHVITDGDIQKNEFIKFEYAGEVYGDYNYFIAEKAREVFLKKIRSEVIIIHTTKPQLGIMRGDQLRFVWYDVDSANSMNQDNLEEAGIVKSKDQLSAILGWVQDWDMRDIAKDNPMRINMQYSGQYTCIGQFIRYNKETETWDCWLYLSRPASKRPQVLNKPDDDEK